MTSLLTRFKAFVKDCFIRNKYPRKSFGRIGEHCIIGKDCSLVPENIFMDDYSIIQDRNNFISYKGKLNIGKYSVFAAGCIIVPDTHRPVVGVPFYVQSQYHIGDEIHNITIKEDCWIGSGSILLSNCSLERGVIVGAGSVVTKSFPPYSVIAGVPAKIIAVKFSKEDIIKHEEVLYPIEDRLSISEIDDLFNKYYIGIRVMEKKLISDTENEFVSSFIHNI